MDGKLNRANAATGNKTAFSKKSSKGVWDSIAAYTAQCEKCSKWRLIPTKEKYEEIRERLAEQPFLCETAREWRPNLSCDDETDVVRDGSWRWAIDKPNIPQSPPGWQRILRIRAKGGTKFADVYYVTPSSKRLRSMMEVQSYLNDHPEYPGLSASQFSFQIPSPLEEDYVRKRHARSVSLHDMNATLMPGCSKELYLGGVENSTPKRGSCSNLRLAR